MEKAKLCVPTSWDNKLLEGIYKINKDENNKQKIHEIYGAMQMTPFGGGRPSSLIPCVRKEEVFNHVKIAHGYGLEVNYLINPMCCGGAEFDQVAHRAMIDYLEWLYGPVEVDTVTTAIPYFIDLVKEQFPDLKICTSVNSKINSPQRARFYEKMGVDRIIIDNLIGRRFDLIKAIRNSVKCDLEVLVNEPCLLQCPYQLYHQTLFGHGSRANGAEKPPIIIDYPQIKCGIERLNNPVEIIKAPWTRPEDTKYLEAIGVNFIKLAGRMQPTDWILKCARAYSLQKYEGNVYELIEKQGLCSSEYNILLKGYEDIRLFRFYIDNRDLDGFIEPFVKGKMHCELGCKRCNYCEKVAKRVIKFDKVLLEKHLNRLQKALKVLTRSEFIQEDIYTNLLKQHNNAIGAEA